MRQCFVRIGLGCACLLIAGTAAVAQSNIVALNTGGGSPLITEMRLVTVSPDFVAPRLEFNYGFATDETQQPGVIPDSITITLQNLSQSLTLIYLTTDTTGTSLAPVSPGTVSIDPATIRLDAIGYPNLSPVLTHQFAAHVSAPIPDVFAGQNLNVFFDLSDNGDAVRSQAWFSDLTVVPVPEPAAGVLLSVAAVVGLAIRRLR